MIQRILAIWSLVPLPFLNPAWTSGSSQFMYCWSLAWRILSITLLGCEMSAIVRWFEHSLALPFFGIGMKTDLFQSWGHWWVFQIFWHIELSTFTAWSFRIWNSSTGIPSHPLALFVVMLPKVHLTSHSRMSGSRWVIAAMWLSESWRYFLYRSTMYSCHLLCSQNRKKESRMEVAKRQGREKPVKIEQRKVRGSEWGPQVEQIALMAGPVYIGQAQGEGKTYKKRSQYTVLVFIFLAYFTL